jgi:hypothetical protein
MFQKPLNCPVLGFLIATGRNQVEKRGSIIAFDTIILICDSFIP